MNIRKNILKKGFTLVELVVVVAIIAILSGVSVAAYQGLTNKANKASDQETLSQINRTLAAEGSGDGANLTCYDAIQDLYKVGLDMESLQPSSRNSEFVWDQDNDRFAIIDNEDNVIAQDSTLDLTDNKAHIWKLASTYPENPTTSIYLKNSDTAIESIDITTGFDTGINQSIKEINFVAPTSNEPVGDITIRTNLVDCNLSITALGTNTIQHYGICGEVNNIQTGSSNKYIENGTVCRMVATSGTISLSKTAKVFNICRTGATVPTIEQDFSAYLYDTNAYRDRNFQNSYSESSYIVTDSSSAYYKRFCGHALSEVIIDACSAYDICKYCGKTLYMFKQATNQTLIVSKKSLVLTENVANKSISPLTVKCGIYKTSGASLESGYCGYQCVTSASSAKFTDLTSVWATQTLTQEQCYCSHSDFEYSDISNTEYQKDLHKVTCKDCGFSYVDIHTTGDTCSKCNRALHHFDESTHLCTNHTGYSNIVEQTIGSVTITYSVCGNYVAIWGFNDAAKEAYNMTEKSSTTFSYGSLSYYLPLAYKMTVEFKDATYIPKYYFYDTQKTNNIYKIILPDTLTDIGNYAFGYTRQLKEINLPSSLNYIGYGAFNCSGITEANIPAGITNIFGSTFNSCYSIEKIEINEGTTTIGSYAMESCYHLKYLYLPSTITHINYDCIEYNTYPDIYYNGTVAEWNSKVKFYNGSNTVKDWFYDENITTIHCTDGDLVHA